MDFPEVKAFNAELSGLYDNKPPISKAKMSAITRGAIKAIKFYKHVVHSVEKFIQKCKPEYKVPGLYVIDSIVRQSRHQFGQDKDVFAPRFAKNMQQTFANLFRCPPENKGNIIRVLNLWQKNNVFGPDVIQPLMDMADPNHPLHQELQQQQNNTANGSSINLNASHNSDKKISPVPAPLHTPPDNSPMGDSFQDQPSGNSGVKFNRKLLNDFEYESEDDSGAHDPPPHSHAHSHSTHTTHTSHAPLQQTADTLPLGSILTNPEIMRQLQSLQAQMQMMTGMQIPNLMPMMSDMQLQQNQSQNLPYMNKEQKQNESKDDMVESDIEFVETGPQVIEIPDANDSRSPSPRRRHRSRSRSPKRRRRSRSRSRSPRRRREKDRERERERERDRNKDKSHKDREADKEKQREREKRGLPPIKKEHLSVCSTTLWVGHLSKLATQEELSDLFGAIGGVVSIDVVPPRGCAFVVMERRRDAHKALMTLNKHKLHTKEITVAWAPGKGVKGREWKDYWEAELGVSYLPWGALQARWALGALSLDALEDGGAVDEDSAPPWLPPRMIPKTMLDGMGMLGLPPAALPPLPAAMPAMPALPPGMTPGIPPGMPPGMPPGIRPPSLPAGVPGLQPEAVLPPGGALLRFPGMPPQPMQPMPQPGLGQLGGFLGGLLTVGGLVGGVPLHHAPIHHAPPRPTEVTRTDDAMDLDTEDNHMEENRPEPPEPAPALSLSDQLQALLSNPPPGFNVAEPPPGFPASEPAPDKDDDKKERDRDRRDRDRERRDRPERERRDRGGRDRDRGGRDRDRDRGSDRDRDREGRGRDRRGDRGERGDRDSRDSRENRFNNNATRDNNRERSRSKSPREGLLPGAGAAGGGEKTLQERLWEMANGKRDDFPSQQDVAEENRIERGPPLDRMGRPPLDADAAAGAAGGDGGWTALPPRRAAPHHPPPFRAELRMRGPPRQPMRGPWMDGPGQGVPPFGPRFNGMPFNRPPFDGGPLFDGPPRFERPPFNRMPFDGPNRPPFDGPRPPFDGPRPPFDGPRPPFDGPRPPFDGPRPPFDGPRPPFDGSRPPFDGPRPPFDGARQFEGPPFEDERSFDGPPRFDGAPEFFDRNNRRFEDREFNDRGWNGDRERDRGDREWGDRRNNEWDDRRRDRFRDRDHDDNNRFRDRNERRRNFDDRPERGDRPDRQERDRPDRGDKAERGDRSDKSDKSDRGDKNDRGDRNERGDKNDRGDKNERSDKNDRGDKADRPRGKDERSRADRQKDRKSRWGAAEEITQSEDIVQSEGSERAAGQENTAEKTHVENNDAIQKVQVEKVENIMDKTIEVPQSSHNISTMDAVESNRDMCDLDTHSGDTVMETEKETRDSEPVAMETAMEYEQTNEVASREEPVIEHERETPSYNEIPEIQESKESFEQKATEPDVPTFAPDLYDANEVVDTSFSLPVKEPVIENIANEPVVEHTESKSDDIFDQPKELEKGSENKETLETP